MSAAADAFSPRTLRVWRDHRLSLAEENDGGIVGRFRFEGSTCGNVPLTLIYTARLAPAEAGHRIVALSAAPEPGDTGHTRMCSYFEGSGRILETLRTEQPLLGEPLAAALAWRPALSPAGCVCAASSRAHKWLAVLQTLHFALAERAAAPPALSS